MRRECKPRSDEVWTNFRPELYNNAPVICPLCGERKGAPYMSGGRKTNLYGVLRHQAAHRDPLSERLRLPRRRPRPSACRDRPAAGARCRAPRAAAARSQRAPVAAVFPDRHASSRDTSRPSCSRSSTTTWRKRLERWPRPSRRRRAASSTITGRRRCPPNVWRPDSSRCWPRPRQSGGSAFDRDAAVVLCVERQREARAAAIAARSSISSVG